MGLAEVGLPIFLMILAFTLKLFVGKNTSAADFIQAIIELPIDVMFLALSFLAAFIMTHTGQTQREMLVFLAFIVSAIVIVAFSKKAVIAFEDDKVVKPVTFSLINYGLSLGSVICSLTLLKGVAV
ncbi:hypothetical protein M2G88_21570 [Vibrio vulnificus]|uniref:hypothetical protein n=1 Tax=Vibrio vulnificus TaxID=672 RepID=UPI00165D63C0|nr:hypothetical protein [Vibrio vulnificus]MCU8238606.1 hypothetical protein [Vibrio vulnificus]